MDWLIYITVYTLAWLLDRMPKRFAMVIGNGMGHLLHLLLKKRRRIALENLKIAFGNTLSDKERRKICQESFINIGKTAVEFLRFRQLTLENIWREVTVQGKEHLIQALNQGKLARLYGYRILGIGNSLHWSTARSSRIEQKRLPFRLKINGSTHSFGNIGNT